MFKVVVAGSRDFNNYDLLRTTLLDTISKYDPFEVEIVSGGARGADTLGERFAREYGCQIKQFIPDWDGLGKKAGYIRNWEMAKYADACIAFWDCESKGTEHMINLAKKEGIELNVVKY